MAPHTGHVSNSCHPIGSVIEPMGAFEAQNAEVIAAHESHERGRSRGRPVAPLGTLGTQVSFAGYDLRIMRRRDFAWTMVAPLAARAARQPSYGQQYPGMLNLLAKRINETTARRDRERARITTPADIETSNRVEREKMIQMIHGLPERNPLQPVTVSRFERNGYRVENVMLQSRPNFRVTGKKLSGRSHESQVPVRLHQPSRAGFVVLGYDPVGPGERLPLMDPGRIGCAGHSGGGPLTRFIAATG